MSSELKLTNLKHASSGSNNLVLASDGNVSITNTLSAGTLGSSVVGNWGWKLLQTVTFGGSSSSVDVGSSSLITTTYSTYKIILEDISLADGVNLRIQFYINSSLATSTGYDYVSQGFDSGGSTRIAYSHSEANMRINTIGFGGVADASGINVEMTVTKPTDTRWHAINWTGGFHNTSNYRNWFVASGGHTRNQNAPDKGALTGFKFYTSNSSNPSRGTIRLYGVINA
tara:strand:+ start:1359 stop:2042 length:684 start_codon:yes stop_codon:yes gene_type:complete